MARRESVQLRRDYLNFLRFSLDESAAATFTQLELDTNLSAERGILMEIHSIEFESLDDILMREVAAGSSEQIICQVTRESKTANATISDADVIAKMWTQISRSSAIGTDAGPLWLSPNSLQRVDFPLPIPYVKPSIFVGLVATTATASRIRGRIGYTLRDIAREEFLELLVALQ